MKPSKRSRRSALVISWVAGLALAAAVGVLVVDWARAIAERPGEREKLTALESAVREDASHAAELSAEYDRQRDATLALRTRRDIFTVAIVVSAVLCIVAGKWHARLRGDRSPTIDEIAFHRGDRARPAARQGPERRRAPARTPGSAAPPEIDLGFVDRVIEEEGTSTEAAVPILQRIQRHYRYLPDEAIARVCERTEISPQQIAGVSTFYARFRHSPVGRHVVRVCQGTACHVAGSGRIRDEVRRSLRIPEGEDTDPERVFTIDEVACVGCCSLAPVVLIEDETVGRLTPATAVDSLESYRRRSER